MRGRVLVVDVGTSSVRAAIVDGDARVVAEHRAPLLPDTPAPGLVEFDAAEMARVSIELATRAIDSDGPVDALGIANQRASTVVWERADGTPVAPGLGWQDLRTVGRCLELSAAGIGVAPNHSATKVEHLLDVADPDRTRDLCVGTVDSWLAWSLSGGQLHVTDATNAQVTALRTKANDAWSPDLLDTLRIPAATLPRVVDSTGALGTATVLPGAPPIAGIIGDQQGSLLGQGCVRHADAKVTFGTGGMLDVVVDGTRPDFEQGDGGTFPIVTRRTAGADAWGLEAVMLAAGTNVEWLRDDLGLIATAEESDAVAATCDDTGDVWYVPAPLGLGTPHWDYGARGALVGLTRGTDRAQIVRGGARGDRTPRRRPPRGRDGGRRCVHRAAQGRRWHGGEPGVPPGARRRVSAHRRGRHRCGRRRPSVPPSAPGSRWGSGRATRTSPRPGDRPGSSSPARRPIARGGRRPCRAPRAGSPHCRP